MKRLLVFLFMFSSCKVTHKDNGIDVCFSPRVDQFQVLDFSDNDQLDSLDGHIAGMIGEFTFLFENISIGLPASPKAYSLRFIDTIKNHAGELRILNGKKVRAYGILRTDDKGSGSFYEGTLDSVFCIKQEN